MLLISWTHPRGSETVMIFSHFGFISLVLRNKKQMVSKDSWWLLQDGQSFSLSYEHGGNKKKNHLLCL
jgi:broad specificity phosphatase PhoE